MDLRSEKILALRPELNLSQATEDADLMIFQNTILRPILKFQNDVLLATFIHKCNKQGVVLGQFSSEAKDKFVRSMLGSDNNYRNLVLGMVVGLFTAEEQEFYLEHAKDVNKRILSMLRERIIDNIS